MGSTSKWGLALTCVAGLAALLVCSACKSGTETEAPHATGGNKSVASAAKIHITAGQRRQADFIFKTRCSTCHGMDGRGDGPGSANLNPKPQNYHDQAWQAKVTDAEIEKAIMYGGAAVGRSPTMAANPDLISKPEVVAALREKVRAFGKEK